MFKKLFLFVSMGITCIAHGQDVYFTAVSPSGHTLSYSGDTTSLTVSVGADWSDRSSMSGNLVIPSSVAGSIVEHVAFDYNADTVITRTRTFTFTVTRIGGRAFYESCGLTSVTLPGSLTSIGDHAFDGCSGLTSITLPSSVTSIGNYAFYWCSGLTSVTLPGSVTSIGDHAFDGCRGLTSVTLPGSLTSIGSYAFNHCSSLNLLVVPSTVTSIGGYAFDGIRHVVYAGSDEDYNAFEGTLRSRAYENGLLYADAAKTILHGSDGTVSHLVIPSTVRVVPEYAFLRDSSITSLTIPSTVDTIGPGAFACPNLTTVNYNAASKAFGGMFWLVAYYDTIRANITNLTIGDAVTYIPDAFMFGMTSLTQLTIPASVDSIGYSAFYGTGLTSLTIPYGVKYIGPAAFHCPNLTTLRFRARRCDVQDAFSGYWYNRVLVPISNFIIGDSVEYIPGDLLIGDTLLISVTIPASVKNIGYSAFRKTRLTSVTIPATVDTIGYRAFGDIPTLETVYYNAPNAYHESNSSPFYREVNCHWVWDEATQTDRRECPETAPMSIFIGSNVHSLPPYIFASLPITDVTLPNSLQTIGPNAFAGCRNLTSIVIPDAVTSIGDAAFGSCQSLSSVALSNSLQTIGPNAFSDCSSLTSIVIPDGVTSIGGRAFSACDNLQAATIGNGVTAIGESAFSNTPLRRLTIGSSVASIGSRAFSAMTNPDTIFMLPTVPPAITANTFENMPTNARIMLPCGTLEDYQEANYWSVFTRMAEAPSCFTLITVGSNDLNKGTVAGGGRYSQGSIATLSALAKKDFAFAGWADGNNDNPRLVLVGSDASYTANFADMAGGVVHDTTVVTLRDTVTVNVHDTTVVTLTDTLVVHDTLVVSTGDTLVVYRDVHDTIYLHDTVYITNIIHDTVYIDPTQDIDGAMEPEARLYQRGGQLVVEGAEGRAVVLYDAVGRRLAVRREESGLVLLDVPASGAYLVRVGEGPARRVVVVR